MLLLNLLLRGLYPYISIKFRYSENPITTPFLRELVTWRLLILGINILQCL